MSRAHLRHLPAIVLLAAMADACASEVTIYRCTDGQGHLTLRDTPCLKGERQQARQMLRPTDPPRRSTPKAIAAPAPAAAPGPARVIVVQAPRPLYECMTPDGARYTSDSGEGTPRWVPLWTLGYPAWGHRDRFDAGGLSARIGGRFDNGRFDVRIGDPIDRRGPRPPPGPPLLAQAYPAGTWVRDECHALPAAEVCDRLRDRRYELDRRYNSALQGERAGITLEQRGIDARLSNDCGVHY